MLRKIVLSIIGFGLGAFMLFNSLGVAQKISQGVEWTLTPQEKLFSCSITGIVGLVLVIWTYLLIKKR